MLFKISEYNLIKHISACLIIAVVCNMACYACSDNTYFFKDSNNRRISYTYKKSDKDVLVSGKNKKRVILFLQGYNTHIGCSKEFREQLLLKTKADVWVMDWPGAGKSDKLADNLRQKVHIDTFDSYIAALDCFINNILLPYYGNKNNVEYYVVAMSMGGAVFVKYLQNKNGHSVFNHFFTIAPMIQFNSHGWPRWLMGIALKIIHATGFGTSYAFGYKEAKINENPDIVSNKKYQNKNKFIKQNLYLAGPTFDWVQAANNFTSVLVKKSNMEKMNNFPTTIFMVENDKIVENYAIKKYAKMNKNTEIIELKNMDHCVLYSKQKDINKIISDIDVRINKIENMKR